MSFAVYPTMHVLVMKETRQKIPPNPSKIELARSYFPNKSGKLKRAMKRIESMDVI